MYSLWLYVYFLRVLCVYNACTYSFLKFKHGIVIIIIIVISLLFCSVKDRKESEVTDYLGMQSGKSVLNLTMVKMIDDVNLLQIGMDEMQTYKERIAELEVMGVSLYVLCSISENYICDYICSTIILRFQMLKDGTKIVLI